MKPTQIDDIKLSHLLKCKLHQLGPETEKLFLPLSSKPGSLAKLFRYSYQAARLAAVMHRAKP